MNTHFVYFSPTSTTKTVTHTMFDVCSFGLNVTEHDLTDLKHSGIRLNFSADDLVIFGIPVYSGRVPKTATDRFRNLCGNGAPAILIATYGNRAYDDALLELSDLAQSLGFVVIAATAIIAEHSVARKIAAGRPDVADKKVMQDFAEQIIEKYYSKKMDTPTIKGSRPFCKYQNIPFKPKGNNKCVDCGHCVELCPVGAISRESPKQTNKSICISCMRCVRFCPQDARCLSKMEEYIAYNFLARECKHKKANMLFI